METTCESYDHSYVLQQFPQPSKPLHMHDTNIESTAAETRFSDKYFDGFYDLHEENRTAESGEGNGFLNYHDYDHDHESATKILRGVVDELDEKGREMFQKLVSRVEKDVPIERIFRETLHDLRGMPVSDVFEKFLGKLNSKAAKDRTATADRDVVVGGFSMSEEEESQHKLDRFKVKTVNVVGVGVVKEEQN
ncbi:hypothetical protein Salat_2346600 [Sesamum alatum]|uniref:Uncharacterized protein n=1 Tax=Sesamum alatum TaxID=300844 RepID=A0AAE1XXB7_9LAMI|nr:hypothetical protein Salat_2346600 [Sesamum alatum]